MEREGVMAEIETRGVAIDVKKGGRTYALLVFDTGMVLNTTAPLIIGGHIPQALGVKIIARGVQP